MDIRGILTAFIIVLVIMALIAGALHWPDWTIFVGTGVVIIPLLYFALKR
jgi:DNA-binding transcriptional regulator of glucitol operon